MKKSILIFIIFLSSVLLFTDVSVNDLQQKLKTAKGTKKIDIWTKLIIIYSDQSPEIVRSELDKAIYEADKIGYKKGLINLYKIYADYYYDRNMFDDAEKYYLIAVDISLEINNKKKLWYLYNALANIYSKKSDYKRAVKYYLSSITNCKNNIEKAQLYNNIATIYLSTKENEKALKYLNNAMETIPKNEDYILQTIYTNLGILYHNKKDYDLSKIYYQKSLNINKKINNQKGLAMNYNNLANIYMEEKKFDKALNYYKKSLKIKMKSNQPDDILFPLINISKLYIEEKRFKEAEKYIKKALVYEKQSNDLNLKKELFQTTYAYFLGLKNYKSALKYYKKYHSVLDSLNKIADKKVIENIKLKYENKTQKHKFKTEIYKQKIIKITLFFILLIILIIASFIFYHYKKIQKINTALLRQIQENKRILSELEKAKENLKEKVELRTKQLEIKNIELKREIEENKKNMKKLADSEKLAALGEMAAEMAHEIKNPITIIKSTSQLLKRNYNKYDEDKIKKMLDIFLETSNRINDILNQLRDFTKEEEFNFERKDLSKIIRDVKMFVDEKCKEKRIDIIFKKNQDPMFIMVDESQIYKVILNLILNAINAIKQKGIIKISLFKKENNVILQISDNGKGIKKENLKKIFNPFFSTTKSGMGLGLSIVYRILKRHNAQIEVESKENEGTTFTIIFNED